MLTRMANHVIVVHAPCSRHDGTTPLSESGNSFLLIPSCGPSSKPDSLQHAFSPAQSAHVSTPENSSTLCGHVGNATRSRSLASRQSPSPALQVQAPQCAQPESSRRSRGGHAGCTPLQRCASGPQGRRASPKDKHAQDDASEDCLRAWTTHQN